MRKLSDLIILVRGGGEVGSAISHRLTRSHFRVCITEIAQPLAVSRGACFSEAIYDLTKTVEDITAERALPSLEQVYRVWRNGNIPIVVDPELSVKPLFKPDALINAMMLKRETNTRMDDAPLVIGIGPGFTAGVDVHMVIESNNSNNLGQVIVEGESEKDSATPVGIGGLQEERVIWAEDAGVFTTEKNIGDSVTAGDVIGKLNDVPLEARISGMLRGLLRNEVKVLANGKLAEIDPENDRSVCFSIRYKMRAIAGGALEAVMMALNIPEANQ
jgi:xanthine dehydrogenase accessory factor